MGQIELAMKRSAVKVDILNGAATWRSSPRAFPPSGIEDFMSYSSDLLCNRGTVVPQRIVCENHVFKTGYQVPNGFSEVFL